jgi:hypothetical protein
MAPPPWDGVVQSQSDSLVTPHTYNMPIGTAENDRVLVLSFMGRNRTQGYTWNDSFTSITGSSPGGTIYVQGGNQYEIVAAYRDMPSSPPATITGTPSQTKAFVGWAGRCPAGTFDPATAPIITFDGGSPTSSNAPSLDPPWDDDTLFISGYAGEEFAFASYPLPDDQAFRESGNICGAICSMGQSGGAALDLGPWAAFFDEVNGTILVAVRGFSSGPDLAQLPATESITVLTPRKSKPAAQLSEASTINALTVRKEQVLAQLVGTSELIAWAGAVKTKPLGDILVESGTILPMGDTIILGQIVEPPSELLPFAGAVKTKPVGQLTATEALQALTAAKALPLGQLVEAGQINALGLQRYLGQLVEASQLMPLLGGSLPDHASAQSSGLMVPITTSGLYCHWCTSAGLVESTKLSSRRLGVSATTSGLRQPVFSSGLREALK